MCRCGCGFDTVLQRMLNIAAIGGHSSLGMHIDFSW
jgi:hypothetical protein